MRAAVLYGKEDVRLEERPLPQLEAGEVLLKIGAALTCGTDLKVFRNGYHARMIQPPALFGHEFAGTVHEVGTGVTGWKKGDRVVAANSAPCGNCFFCRKDQPNLCEDLLFVNGAYAEFLRLPARIVEKNLLAIPPSLSFEAAALTEPLACVARGVTIAHPASEETVVILGAGPVGLMFVQLCRRQGARVMVIGKGQGRLEIARKSGAQEALDLNVLADPVADCRARTPGKKGADLVIEAVGRPAAWQQAIQSARPGGRVLLFGGCPSGTKVDLDARRFHYEELALLSSFHHTPQAIRESLHLLSEGAIRTELFVSGKAPLAELPPILRRMLTSQDEVKTAIIP